MNTDHKTEVQSVRDIIRVFLDIPMSALPSAQCLDDEDGNGWERIREYMLDDSDGCGIEVRLTADRAGWREGVNITLR